jgi:hypothetical protein
MADDADYRYDALISKVLDMGERKRRLVPLVIEAVTRPVWLYDIAGVGYTDADPLLAPLDRLLAMLRNP